jgi:ERCC4-type nuclease
MSFRELALAKRLEEGLDPSRRQTTAVARGQVRIVVDVHEGTSGIAELIRQLGAEVEIASLRAGDYLVGENTLVERKRVRDLHAAIVKGRLWPQLAKLGGACDFPFLLVEGTDIDRGPLHPNAVRGACLAVVDLGIALLRTETQRDSALWLHRLAVRCQRLERPPDRPSYSQQPKAVAGPAAAEAVLAAVPGLSTTSARALLERFGSVAAVVAAGPDEWLQVQGIGPERARLLAETLSLRWGASR